MMGNYGTLSGGMGQPEAPYAKLMRGVGGAVGGMGQAMMDQNMRRTYSAGRSGGFRDLMENEQIGDFIQGQGRIPEFMQRLQDFKAKMAPAQRGLSSPAAPVTGG